MDMKFCGQCGESLQPTSRFCTSCGVALGSPRVQSGGADATNIRLRAATEMLARNDVPGALAILEPLCAEEPSMAIARAYRGIAYLRLVRVADARDELEEAVRLAPESFICRSKYAEFLGRLGFFDQAVAQLDAALAVSAPDLESRRAAIELRQFCRDKAKGIYYRHTARPKLSNLLPKFVMARKTLQIQGEN